MLALPQFEAPPLEGLAKLQVRSTKSSPKVVKPWGCGSPIVYPEGFKGKKDCWEDSWLWKDSGLW